MSRVADGREVFRLERGGRYVAGIAFTPDGRTLLAGFGDGAIVRLNFETKKPRGAPLLTNSGYIGGVATSPDGKLFVAGTERGDLVVGDVRTGALIGRPIPLTLDRIVGVTFVDARHVIAASSDATAPVLDLNPNHWSARACQLAGRNLTASEWREYLGNRSYKRACPPVPNA